MKIQEASVTPELLSTLHELFQMNSFSKAALGGGTSLALRFGHRKSIDIDLFLNEAFHSLLLQEELSRHFIGFALLNRTEGSLNAAIGNTKIDVLLHTYPLLGEYDQAEDLRLLSLEDMAAMKINAVTNRGSKKDFSDLLLLHQNGIPLEAAVQLFCAKYGPSGRFMAIKSLNWFEDAESEPDPVYLNGWTWSYVKRQMTPLAAALI